VPIHERGGPDIHKLTWTVGMTAHGEAAVAH